MNDDMTCEDANWLLAAYVTDSLTEEERCSFASHLVECRLHDDELNGYRSVASRLPSVVDAVEPPSSLRSNLLDSFDGLVNAPRTQETPRPIQAQPAPQELPARAPSRGRGTFGWLRSPGFAYGIAAALAIAVVALAGLAVTQNQKPSDGDSVVRLANEENGAQLNLTYIPSSKMGILDLTLPPLPSDRVYQAWQITDSGPVSIGIFRSEGTTAFNADLSRATNIAITVEPAGGSIQPTTTPMLVTKFKS